MFASKFPSIRSKYAQSARVSPGPITISTRGPGPDRHLSIVFRQSRRSSIVSASRAEFISRVNSRLARSRS